MSSQKKSDKPGALPAPVSGFQKTGLLPPDWPINRHHVGDVLFGRYCIIEVNEGANSTIYKAIDSSTNAAVAVKEVNLSHCRSDSEGKGFKPLDMVKREFRAGRDLIHPNLTSYHEAFEDKETGAYYLVREWADGKSLNDMMGEGKRFTDAEIALVTEKVLLALGYLHSKNPPIIHRDVKPANIVAKIENDQILEVKLIDLGAIPEVPDRKNPHTRMTTHIYTPGFGAPEALSNPLTQSDLFSVGATILFLKTRLNADDVYNPEDATFNIPESVTGRLKVLLEGSLQCPTGKRFNSASEMRAALLGLAIEKRPNSEEIEAVESLSARYDAKNSLFLSDKDWDPGHNATMVVMGGGSLAGAALGAGFFYHLFGASGWVWTSIGTGLFLGAVGGGMGISFVFMGAWALIKGVKEKLEKRKLREEIAELTNSAYYYFLNGSITDPKAQESLAAILAKASEEHGIINSVKACLLLRSGVLVSEKAEETLAALVRKPKHARQLLESGKIRSLSARATLAAKIPGYESENALVDSPPAGLLDSPEKKEE